MEISTLQIKEAKTSTPVHPLIRKRWSARSFNHKDIEPDQLNSLLEAASWAPSSMNEQPWRYIYAYRHDQQNFQKFHECLMKGNQPWTLNASVLMLSLAHKYFSRSGKENQHAWHDVGAANSLLMLQAADMNIYGHVMAGFDPDKTREIFQLPEELEPVSFIALGYLDVPDKLEEPFRSREMQERSRKSIDQIAFRNELMVF
ncbi:MAG: nitroreductase family protein [Candidatus Cyclobacteriaceae bacterium M3_2C_046]